MLMFLTLVFQLKNVCVDAYACVYTTLTLQSKNTHSIIIKQLQVCYARILTLIYTLIFMLRLQLSYRILRCVSMFVQLLKNKIK